MTTTRYPNQFKVRGSGSPNIITLGFAPRSLAKSHAWALAAWLVSYVGDMPSFLAVLIDVWVSRYGLDQTPAWLIAANPGWKPFDPPARPMAPSPVGPGGMPMPVPVPQPIAPPITSPRQGSGPSAPRFTLPDGTPLDADAVRAIGEDAARTIGAGRASGNGSPKPAPQTALGGARPIVESPVVQSENQSEGEDGDPHE